MLRLLDDTQAARDADAGRDDAMTDAPATDSPAGASRCGDGIVDTGESCDPGRFDATDCASLSAAFTGGRTACGPSCRLDLSARVRAEARCGNAVVEGAEQCDDGNSVDDDACGNDCSVRLSDPTCRDGRDNDCDGATDETFDCGPSRTARTCTVCGRDEMRGTQACNVGSCTWANTCVAGTVPNYRQAYYEGNNPALRHEIGSACNRTHWCQVGQTGYLSQGPGIVLGAANYHVLVRGTFSGGAAGGQIVVEIYDAATGASLHTSAPQSAGIGSIPFSFSEAFAIDAHSACHPIEILVYARTPWPGGAELHDITLYRDSDYRL